MCLAGAGQTGGDTRMFNIEASGRLRININQINLVKGRKRQILEDYLASYFKITCVIRAQGILCV